MRPNVRMWLIAIAAVLIAFLIGYGWQRMVAGNYRDQLEQTTQELELQRIESTLGAAAIEAQSGSFEIARQHASDFFTRLQAEVDSLPATMQADMRGLLARRDALITALSRNDVQSGPQLAQMFRRYRSALGEPVGPTDYIAPAPVTPPADTTPRSDTVAPVDTMPGPAVPPDTTVPDTAASRM